MTDIVANSACQAVSSLVNQESLLQSLDSALEQYLNLLDSYQRSRQQLAGHLSSGYISLAQANFRSPNRTRYGQDFYDGRMQAMTKINIFIKKPADSPMFFVAASPASSGSDSSTATLHPVAPLTGINDEDNSEFEWHVDPFPSTPLQNPVNWFGILTPKALRDAQSSFTAAVRDIVPDLATVLEKMRSLEVEIGALRDKIRHSEQI